MQAFGLTPGHVDAQVGDCRDLAASGVADNSIAGVALYNEDMQRICGEVAHVPKPGTPAAFVIGDATGDQRDVTTTDEMVGWAETAGLRLERSIPQMSLASTAS